MGGRGKTPLVIHLARLLLEAGERPSVLSRGYGRRRVDDGVVVVSDGERLLADLDRSGDEPLMIARAVRSARVLVGDSRVTAGALAERVFGATVHLLDDGFQHRALCRTADLVVVTPDDLEGRRVPFGKLREAPRALARANAVILDGDGPLPAGVTFRLRRHLGEPCAIEAEAATADRRQPVVGVAGIARPERFHAALTEAGWNVASFMGFGDHHRFTRRDLGAVAGRVSQVGAAAVLTTDKDAVRLRLLRPLPVPVFAAPLEVEVEPAEAFRSWLLQAVRSARA